MINREGKVYYFWLFIDIDYVNHVIGIDYVKSRIRLSKPSYIYIYIIVEKVLTQIICTFSTTTVIIRAYACRALFVATLTNTVHLIYMYIHIYNAHSGLDIARSVITRFGLIHLISQPTGQGIGYLLKVLLRKLLNTQTYAYIYIYIYIYIYAYMHVHYFHLRSPH